MVKLLLPIIFIIALLCIGGVVLLEVDANLPQIAAPEVFPLFSEKMAPLQAFEGDLPLTPYATQAADNITYQIFKGYILAYNPALPLDAQFFLVPIGEFFNLENMPSTYRVADPGPQANLRYYDGIAIWSEAYPLIDRFPNLLGKPLTPLLFNQSTGMLEQYFQNTGLTRSVDGKLYELKFLSYGLWWHAYGPSQTGLTKIDILNLIGENPPPTIISPVQAQEILLSNAERLNLATKGFTGERLTDAILASDGNYEMGFVNVVMYVDPKNPRTLNLRPISEEVSCAVQEPEPMSADPDKIFYKVDEVNMLGYNVNSLIADFASLNSDLAGSPIGSTIDTGSTYFQCFTNYAVVMDKTRIFGQPPKISLLNFGEKYLKLHSGAFNIEPTQTPVPPQVYDSSKPKLSIRSWYFAPDLVLGTKARIGGAVFSNRKPAANYEVYTEIYLPDGTQLTFTMPSTNEQGSTEIELPDLKDAAGNFVEFQVCVKSNSADDYCEDNQFYNQP